MTSDELTVFIDRSPQVLLMASRATRDAEFSVPTVQPAIAALVSVDGLEYQPWPTGDGLVLYFHRSDTGLAAIFAAVRPSPSDPFSPGSLVYVDGSSQNVIFPQISADGQNLYWLDFFDFKIHSARRGSTPVQFVQARTASTFQLYRFVLSSDELTLFYADQSNTDVIQSTRASKDIPFGPGVPLANVNTPEQDAPLFVSPDGCTLYMKSRRPGGSGGEDIWVTHRAR